MCILSPWLPWQALSITRSYLSVPPYKPIFWFIGCIFKTLYRSALVWIPSVVDYKSSCINFKYYDIWKKNFGLVQLITAHVLNCTILPEGLKDSGSGM